MSTNVKSRFLRDVSKHEMTVLLDQGVYRHIRFQRPGDNCCWFELVTWPGHLSIVGDMGTYVFSRTEDMFRFFRRDQLEINEGYWAEKVVSADAHGSVRVYRHEGVQRWFRENLRDNLRSYSKDDRRDIIDQVREVLTGLDEKSEEQVRREIDDISVSRRIGIPAIGATDQEWLAYRRNRPAIQVFSDMWEVSFEEYHPQFLWCLHAVVWGIQQYDATKVAQGASS